MPNLPYDRNVNMKKSLNELPWPKATHRYFALLSLSLTPGTDLSLIWSFLFIKWRHFMGRVKIIADSSNLVCEEKVKFNEDDENFMERHSFLHKLWAHFEAKTKFWVQGIYFLPVVLAIKSPVFCQITTGLGLRGYFFSLHCKITKTLRIWEHFFSLYCEMTNIFWGDVPSVWSIFSL